MSPKKKTKLAKNHPLQKLYLRKNNPVSPKNNTKKRAEMQKRFVAIWFRYLKTDWYTRRIPGLGQVAFALAMPDHGRMVIVAVNPVAEQKGIYPGMAVADARAIFPGVQVLDDKPEHAERILNGLAEWCIRYTPSVAVDLPEGLILDATGCAHL